MKEFIKITNDSGYHLAAGTEGCIVPVDENIGSLVAVHAPALGLYCKPGNRFLAGPTHSTGCRNQYFFQVGAHCERVANPFAHWNSIKG